MRVRWPALEVVARVVRRVELLRPAVDPALRQARPQGKRPQAAVILADHRALEARRNPGPRVVLENRTWELSEDLYLLLQRSRLTAALLPRPARETHKELAVV